MASEEARKNDAEAQRDRTINVPDASQLNDKLDDDLPSGSERDEASRLRSLAADVRDQDEIERNVARQADKLLTEQANERDQKRLEKANTDKQKLSSQIEKLEARLSHPSTTPALATRLLAEISHYQVQVDGLTDDVREIRRRIDGRSKELEHAGDDEPTGNKRQPNESQRDFLIRTGKITPFSKMLGPSAGRDHSNLNDRLLDAEEGRLNDESEEEIAVPEEAQEHRSHRNLMQPGFADDSTTSSPSSGLPGTPQPSRKRRRLNNASTAETATTANGDVSSGARVRSPGKISPWDTDDDTLDPGMSNRASISLDGSEEETCADEDSEGFLPRKSARGSKKTGVKRKGKASESVKEDLASLDDGNEKLYQTRLQSWATRRGAARHKAMNKDSSSNLQAAETAAHHLEEHPSEEWHQPHPAISDTVLDGNYKIPGDIYPSLFDYQKTGVRWLWELYSQQVGGIIGDEMGLGKTIQTISFLAGLHYSKKITKPIIVVAPATVMKQWVNEFHTWWPPFRVSILHSSGSGMMDLSRESRREKELAAQTYSGTRGKTVSKAAKAAKRIVDRVVQDGHVLITTYTGLQTYADLLLGIDWEYAVLDEGHKIRNPNAALTIYCKELRTANRIILSGTPMQNNLVELWSLFDFIFPMKLGTLVDFRNQFEIPIRQGGYANASNLQVQTASRCAETLKDSISPYLLQRFKVDVAADLPKKTEQVLFCKLTRFQRQAYESFLASNEMKSINNGKLQTLFGIDILRKICNHPDLQDHKALSVKPGYDYGNEAKSGKMVVVKELLEVWKKGGHKTLLFAQHRIMLDILERHARSITGLQYRRMDGSTPIPNRQRMVDEFNNNPDLHVFLLTTKVGGLGVNLTGADRVIIYDPDWNPSTDIQARERAWRLGQKRQVQIYRLMVAGTIEEKIYHRQVFKQFLTNKILRDPKQRQAFQLKDLHDLFTLGDAGEEPTETSRLFEGTEVRFNLGSNQLARAPEPEPRWGGETPEPRTEQEEIANLDGIASMQEFQEGKGDEQGQSISTDAINSEDRIVNSIFARNVHSALQHDQVINGKRIITADPKIIEKEAKRVAELAADELKKAEVLARAVPVGTPTWTGEFGVSGRPTASGRGRGGGTGGPSSSTILAGLQSRQAATSNNIDGSNGEIFRRAPPRDLRPIDFMKMIRDYISAQGGKVYTQMLIDQFDRHCTTSERTAEFSAMLKKIATLHKGRGGRGSWELKDEYKGGS